MAVNFRVNLVSASRRAHRRSILSAAERERLLALPDTKDDLISHCTFSGTDLSIIRQWRDRVNRLGFAVQLSVIATDVRGLACDFSVF
jgi:hypothetical protein